MSAWLIFLIPLMTASALAKEEVPEWVTHPPAADGTYFFAVGTGESENAATAKQDAEKQAIGELIQLAFGVEGYTSSDIKTGLNESRSENRVQFSSAQVPIRSAETVQVAYQEIEEHRTRCYVLKRYPKREAARVIQILFAQTPRTHRKASNVAIESDPAGTEALLDGESIGNTPIRVIIPSGTHQITLKKQGYRELKQTVICEPGSDHHYEYRLIKSTGKLSVSSEPTGAKLYINDEVIGLTPLQQIEVPTGRLRIRLTMEGFSDTSRELTIRQDQIKSMKIELQMKEVKARSKSQAGHSLTIEDGSWNAQRFRLVAHELFKRKKWNSLLSHTDRWIHAYPDDSKAYAAQAQAYLMLHKTQKAIASAEVAVKLRRSANAEFVLCNAHFLEGELSTAISFCNSALEMNPESASTYVVLGWIAEEEKEFSIAYDYYRVAALLNPSDGAYKKKLCGSAPARNAIKDCQRPR